MCADRLACYLEGGCPPGGLLSHAGARDRSAPQASMPLTLPGTVFFAGESQTWGGGRAYYDPTVDGSTPARAYLLTSQQFDDVHAQEPPVYDKLLDLGTHDGVPLLTFTSSVGRSAVVSTEPAPAYLDTIGRGIAEAHGWTTEQISSHLQKLVASIT